MMAKRSLILASSLLIFLSIVSKTLSSPQEDTDRLISTILKDYKKEVHPDTRDDGAVGIGLSVVPLHLSMDETDGILHTHMWLVMGWKDNRLRWNPFSYGRIRVIHLASDKIWKPDIRSYNAIQHEDVEGTEVMCYSSGQLYWIPPITTHTSCDFDYTYWPWDVQKCEIILGSWTKSGAELDVYNLNNKNITKVELTNYVPTIWDMKSAVSVASKTFFGENVGEGYPDVTIKFKIARNSHIDRKIAVLPLILVVCLTLATFWTFPLAKSRILLGCTNFFILTFMLIYLRDRLPMSGAQLPMIVSFAGSLGVLVTIQLLASLAIINLERTK